MNTIISLILASLIIVIFLKIRKIHLMQYEIITNIDQKIDNGLRQIEALQSLYLDLKLDKALPITRGWAASPDFLLLLKDEIMKNKPRVVVECSSGISTIVIAKCLEIIGSGHVYSLEHEVEYANKSLDSIKKHGLESWATIIHAPLVSHTINNVDNQWYDISRIDSDIEHIDMLTIDGPPAIDNQESRYPAFPLLKDKLSDGAKIILDDANRPGEKAIIEKWKGEEDNLSEIIGDCEKGCSVLTFRRNRS